MALKIRLDNTRPTFDPGQFHLNRNSGLQSEDGGGDIVRDPPGSPDNRTSDFRLWIRKGSYCKSHQELENWIVKNCLPYKNLKEVKGEQKKSLPWNYYKQDSIYYIYSRGWALPRAGRRERVKHPFSGGAWNGQWPCITRDWSSICNNLWKQRPTLLQLQKPAGIAGLVATSAVTAPVSRKFIRPPESACFCILSG